MTRHVYDAAGRLVESVTEREPEWSRSDVTALVAFLETRRVGSHGQPMSEATSPLADPANPKRAWKYQARVFKDYAAAEVTRFRAEYELNYGPVDWDALRLVVDRVDLA